MGFLEGFMYFRILCVLQSLPLVFAPSRGFYGGPLLGQKPGVRFVSGLPSSEPSAQVRRVCSCKSCSHYQMGEFCRLRRSKRLSMRGGRSRKAAQRVSGLYMNRSLFQPLKPIRLTPHEAPEHAKLQPASSGVVKLTSPLE